MCKFVVGPRSCGHTVLRCFATPEEVQAPNAADSGEGGVNVDNVPPDMCSTQGDQGLRTVVTSFEEANKHFENILHYLYIRQRSEGCFVDIYYCCEVTWWL